jgi:hypothetical protein
MKAYLIGDPCYVVPSEEWEGLLESSDFFRKPVGYTSSGKQVMAFHTAHGDGYYFDNMGNSYSVDAGVIGIMEAEDFKDPDDMMTVHMFDKLPECHANDGVLYFGDVIINTDTL